MEYLTCIFSKLISLSPHNHASYQNDDKKYTWFECDQLCRLCNFKFYEHVRTRAKERLREYVILGQSVIKQVKFYVCHFLKPNFD